MGNIEGHFTVELEVPCSFNTLKLLLVEIPKAVLIHFTLELEGLSDQGSLNGSTNLPGVLRGMQWILLHGLPDFAVNLFQRSRSNPKLGDHDTLKAHHNP